MKKEYKSWQASDSNSTAVQPPGVSPRKSRAEDGIPCPVQRNMYYWPPLLLLSATAGPPSSTRLHDEVTEMRGRQTKAVWPGPVKSRKRVFDACLLPNGGLSSEAFSLAPGQTVALVKSRSTCLLAGMA